jgi:Holliday junction resolvase-like predicted endonuclease
MLPENIVPVVVIALVAGLLVGILLSRLVTLFARRLLLKRRFAHAARGEKDAAAFLRRSGFTIIETQARRKHHLTIDGAVVPYEVRADFLVKKRGVTSVVEVKTGVKAVDPASTDTRRQLLEYALVYETESVYLFDAEAGVLHEVAIPAAGVKPHCRLQMLLAGIALGIILSGVVILIAGGFF